MQWSSLWFFCFVCQFTFQVRNVKCWGIWVQFTWGTLNVSSSNSPTYQVLTNLEHLTAFKEGSSTRMMVKKYYLSTSFQSNWIGAFNFCKSNRMQLVSFANLAEVDRFLALYQPIHPTLNSSTIFVDGIIGDTVSRDSWYSFETGTKIDFDLRWGRYQPDNRGGRENCLAIEYLHSVLGFHDYDCDSSATYNFVCQDIVCLCEKTN